MKHLARMVLNKIDHEKEKYHFPATRDQTMRDIMMCWKKSTKRYYYRLNGYNFFLPVSGWKNHSHLKYTTIQSRFSTKHKTGVAIGAEPLPKRKRKKWQ